MIWVGEEAMLGALAMAVPVADCPSTQVSLKDIRINQNCCFMNR